MKKRLFLFIFHYAFALSDFAKQNCIEGSNHYHLFDWQIPCGSVSLKQISKKSSAKIHFIKFQQDKIDPQPKQFFVAEFEHARIFEDGIVITKENYLFKDIIIKQHGTLLNNHHIFKEKNAVKTKIINATVAVIASPGEECFYHWMLQILPRFEILKKSNLYYDYIYLMPCNLKFQKESLKLLGIDETKIIWGEDNQQIIADKLLVPSIAIKDEANLPFWVVDFLKENVLNRCTNDQLNFKRIFISRKRAKIRKIINEDEIMPELEKLGFKAICLEDYNLPEQAKILNSAEIVIAPHGSGLTNLIYCNATKVIEIFTFEGFTQPFEKISTKLGLKHYSFLTHKDKLEQIQDQKLYSDIYVEKDELMKLIKQII